MSDSQSSGRSAEAQALDHLVRQGLRLLERNWSCRSGELDLVMLDGDTVVFVEVRFDVVAIAATGQPQNLNWIRNAFDS